MQRLGAFVTGNEAYNPLYRIPAGASKAIGAWKKGDYRVSGRATGTTAFEVGTLAAAVVGGVIGEGAAAEGAAESGGGAAVRYQGVSIGTRLGEAELGALGERLASKGLRLGSALDAGGEFGGVFDHVAGEVRLRPGATVYDALHEMLHVQQWEELGPEAYGELENWEREQYVYDQLTQMDEWYTVLTEEERLHAGWYVEASGGMK